MNKTYSISIYYVNTSNGDMEFYRKIEMNYDLEILSGGAGNPFDTRRIDL